MPRKARRQPKKKGPLPPAIEDKKLEDPEMKRAAAEIEDTPRPQAKHGPQETKPDLKRHSDNREEIAKVMKAQSQAVKRAALGPPFQCPKEVTKGCPILSEPTKDQGPRKQPAYDHVSKLPPLSLDSIAAMLKISKPECDKAKTWVDAHEATKVVQARMKAKMEEREELRKKLQRRLHARMALNIPSGPSTNLQAARGRDEEEYSKLSPMERVQKAHERYQKALTEILDL
ncbi:uncharacterized protein ACLA_072650 [Aspergillus clavatus NRRL 1]|uniref:Uncharacterized protein n=1 Tax=Aspergillus clavatus (strain ATCC 1007 / CBS 513.65 / DSM 816 / NCTC 3887 / NRRL 1 / QM 1276 / 107) TaxID=344612 RepID=A1C761_ASPCL|nr:uncharacterized protein ACLA_072650 [Aspergillus clavatus NRRL 1]EAW14232.1 conserved hypothetical protein [Aspergillus clavatus NRRL 1]